MKQLNEFSKYDFEYYAKGEYDNKKYFDRLNGEPDFSGLKILDIGCGHGSLCVYIAHKSPKRVVGIDVNNNRIAFAKANLQQNYPNLLNIVDFKNINVDSLDEFDFDIIVSKNAFEHIIDLDKTMPEIIKRLKNNGYLFVGFGPLYNSYYGDHKQTHSVIPWGHLLRSEKSIIKSINKKREENKKISSIHELGLNKYSLKKYKELFNNCGLEIIYFGINKSNNLFSKIFTQIAKIGFLREYFTHNIYCIMRKE